MSFLNQLKSQAAELQSRQAREQRNFEESTAQTEYACNTVSVYLQELARQLNVIAPPGPTLSVDGKTPWPAMRLVSFRCDARKKTLRGKEVYDYLSLGWDIVPQHGKPLLACVKVNFPPDLERVQKRLGWGAIQHERSDIRHPEKNALLAYSFEFLTQSRGSVVVTPDHDTATLAFRAMNLSGFELVQASWPARQVGQPLLDELAKRIVQQPHAFG